MGSDTGFLRAIVTAVVLPFRLVGRVIGYAIAILMLLAVPVVLVATFTTAWFLPFFAAETLVGLPVVGPVGIVTVVGAPTYVADVPMLYPLVTGVLTSLVLGWPDPDYEGGLESIGRRF